MSRLPKWRTALVHHWLVTMRGGERVFEALAELYPSADLFTLVCDKSRISQALRSRRITTSFLQRFPRSSQWYPYYLPLFPRATEGMNLSDYDLIISSDAATMKGVRGGPVHICYCHTPMRYVWSGYDAYHRAAGPLGSRVLQTFRKSLCRWDYEAAQAVTFFVANSRNVQGRIRQYYGRESTVLYPPVDTERFQPKPRETVETGPFLVVSQLVPYKRVDLIVEAFRRSRRDLIVIGDGPERRKLERNGAPNIRFLGSQSEAQVVEAMRNCRAFVFAGEEDFGIVMAEAQACGKPVTAYGRGGATEIVEPGVTGILFEEQSVESLLDALDLFERESFDPVAIRNASLRFGRTRFLREFASLVEKAVS